MSERDFNQGLLEFIQHAPTAFHAVEQMRQMLVTAGFEHLEEGRSWTLKPSSSFFIIRNGSSIVAVRNGACHPAEEGLRLIGAHTDSPCLKIRPSPEISRHGCFQLGVEIYGGVLLSPWFDRDLSLAGTIVDNLGGFVLGTCLRWLAYGLGGCGIRLFLGLFLLAAHHELVGTALAADLEDLLADLLVLDLVLCTTAGADDSHRNGLPGTLNRSC